MNRSYRGIQSKSRAVFCRAAFFFEVFLFFVAVLKGDGAVENKVSGP